MTMNKKSNHNPKFIRAHVLIDGIKLIIQDFNLEDESKVNEFFQEHLNNNMNHSISTGTDVCYERN